MAIRESDFKPVLSTQLIVAIMSDGRWYTQTALRHRMKAYKGLVNHSLKSLRNAGYVRRARNPLNGGRPYHRDVPAGYCYQWTGIPWKNNQSDVHRRMNGNRERYLKWVSWRALPPEWRDILR